MADEASRRRKRGSDRHQLGDLAELRPTRPYAPRKVAKAIEIVHQQGLVVPLKR